MKQRSMPIGPLTERQASLTGKLTRKRRQKLHLSDIPYGTMFCVRVAYRLIQWRYVVHREQGPYPSPSWIVAELEALGVRAIWPAVWHQADWLATCWQNGIALNDARDYGPSKLWTGSDAIPQAVKRAYRR